MKYSHPVNKLLSYGDIHNQLKWPNYLKLGFTEANVPELIQMATDKELTAANSERHEAWAPVHAWRVLGQLKAADAVEPLIKLFHELEDNDWVDDELPTVFGMIGPVALDALTNYLADTSHAANPRIPAAGCICEIGLKNSKSRGDVISRLIGQLKQFENNAPDLNGFLIWYLTELQAGESISVIREAYERECVDLSIVGDLPSVEYELGLSENPPEIRFYVDEESDEFMDEGQRSSKKTSKIGPNDSCPCGSGKKYKNCCGI